MSQTIQRFQARLSACSPLATGSGVLLSLGCSLCGCAADPPLRDETDAILSITRSGADFSDDKTFALVPGLVELCDQAEVESIAEQDCADIDHGQDQDILNAAADDMRELGYKSVAPNEQADLVLVVAVVTARFWYLDTDYCLNQKDSSTCVTPLTSDNVAFPTGSILVHLIPGEEFGDEFVELQWVAAVDQRWGSGRATAPGGASGAYDLQPWISGIHLAFSQSPALAEGGGN